MRRWWLAAAGGFAIAAVFLTLSIVDFERPEDSDFTWLAVPAALLGPSAWSAGGYFFGRWRRRRKGTVEPAAAGATVAAWTGGFIGLIIGAAVGLGLGLGYVELAHVSSFEGMAGYLVVYIFAPLGGITGAIIGAMIAHAHALRRSAQATG
jgi:hypothetical protein